MARTTATLEEIVRAELDAMCKNEFYNKGQLTFFDDEYAFMKKMLNFDDDVYAIVNKTLFSNFTIDSEIDRNFKKMFYLRFQNREINRQTVEAFSTILVSQVMIHQTQLEVLLKNLKDFIFLDKKTVSTGNVKDLANFRNIYSELPQDVVNMSLDNPTMEYASTNTISTNDNKRESDNTTTTNDYDFSVIKSSFNMLENFFKVLEKKCFLRFW